VTVSIAAVGRQGRMDLAFAFRDGRNVIRHSYCEVPFKITRLFDEDAQGFAHLILMQSTAGLFGGDEIECSIRVDAGVRVMLTQQSATKIHPSGDLPAIQRMRIVVESGAVLAMNLEPVIPFTDSRLHQATRIELEPGASLIYWEGLMAGRVGKHERWRFRELMSETRIEMAGRPLYLERFFVDPLRDDPGSAWAMGNSGYLGTGICIREGAKSISDCLHEAMPGAGVDVLGPDMVAIRISTDSGPAFHEARERFLSLTR